MDGATTDRVIRVLVVDDSPAARWGLSAVLGLQGDLQVVGEAEDGPQAVDAVLRCEPDVVLMDLSMPIMDGFAATEQVLHARPATVVLAISAEMDPARQERARQAGAACCLLKGMPSRELVAAIRQVAPRCSPLSPSRCPVAAASRVLTAFVASRAATA